MGVRDTGGRPSGGKQPLHRRAFPQHEPTIRGNPRRIYQSCGSSEGPPRQEGNRLRRRRQGITIDNQSTSPSIPAQRPRGCANSDNDLARRAALLPSKLIAPTHVVKRGRVGAQEVGTRGYVSKERRGARAEGGAPPLGDFVDAKEIKQRWRRLASPRAGAISSLISRKRRGPPSSPSGLLREFLRDSLFSPTRLSSAWAPNSFLLVPGAPG